jgi:hypothetical protein
MLATFKKEPPGYVLQYALWNDRALVARLQSAKGRGAAVYRAHGLLGSAAWWKAIETGRLPLHTVRGTICDLTFEGMDDTALFRLLCDDGSVSQPIVRSAAPASPRRMDRRYAIGRGVIWQHVRLGDAKHPYLFTIAIWLAETMTVFGFVGEEELQLIAASNFAALALQGAGPAIFYALRSVRNCREFQEFLDTVSQEQGGYFIRCEASKGFMAGYERALANRKDHVEYRVPAADIEAFNRNLVGKINVVAKASGPLGNVNIVMP